MVSSLPSMQLNVLRIKVWCYDMPINSVLMCALSFAFMSGKQITILKQGYKCVTG